MSEKIAVIGLGYVGLPLALAFADKFPDTLGFDINARRVEALKRGEDATCEVSPEALKAGSLRLTSNPEDLRDTTFFVVAVPTPIDKDKRPELAPLVRASETVGRAMEPGALVVYESTVYPGLTEEVCGPILERTSGFARGQDFKLGYSPERINPGDKQHTLESIVKIVSGEDEEALERIASAYGLIVPAGIHRAPSIKVAEAAKVIENTQRDLNIALMNELSLIFDRLGIRTKDVLAAAGSKWNFLPFKPGLVGGHCIGVDPYYLTTKAEEIGYTPQIILAGRRINDGMGAYLAQRLVKLLVRGGAPVKDSRVGILGLTFKENVPDLRNSRIPDIIAELRQYGIEPLVHDPLAAADEAEREYGVKLRPWPELDNLDALIVAVAHRAYMEKPTEELLHMLCPGGVLMDVKSAFDPAEVPETVQYWSL